MAECKTEKSKHLQRKNFGTAGEQIEFNFSARIVALNEWKNDIETILWASLLLEGKVFILFERMVLVLVDCKLIADSWQPLGVNES